MIFLLTYLCSTCNMVKIPKKKKYTYTHIQTGKSVWGKKRNFSVNNSSVTGKGRSLRRTHLNIHDNDIPPNSFNI